MNKKYFLAIASLVFFLMLGGGGWCAEPIKIGLIAALGSPTGLANKVSLEIGVEELNKAGGILGRPIELIVKDSKRELPLTVAAYKQLVMTEKCLVVFTEGSEGTSACMQEGTRMIQEFPHLQFALWTANDGITDLVRTNYEKYKFLFRLYGKSGSWFDAEAKTWTLFTEAVGTKKLALMIEEMGWTQPFILGIPGKYPPYNQFLKSKGLQVVYYAKTSIGDKMFLPALEKIAASGADTIFWLGAYSDMITLAKQWAESAAKDIDMVSMSGACSYAAFWNMTGGAALGWSALDPEILIPFTEKTAPFLKEVKKRGAGFMVSGFAAYDGPWILKAAVEKAGKTRDLDALIKAMETIELKRGCWTWKFNRGHDPLRSYPYYPTIYGQFQENGKYVAIFDEDCRRLSNPNNKFIRVKELRAKAGRK